LGWWSIVFILPYHASVLRALPAVLLEARGQLIDVEGICFSMYLVRILAIDLQFAVFASILQLPFRVISDCGQEKSQA
jgi:hypothetical protein